MIRIDCFVMVQHIPQIRAKHSRTLHRDLLRLRMNIRNLLVQMRLALLQTHGRQDSMEIHRKSRDTYARLRILALATNARHLA